MLRLILALTLALSLGATTQAFAFPEDPGYCGTVPTC